MRARRFLVITGIAGASMLVGGCTLDARSAVEPTVERDGTTPLATVFDGGMDAATATCAVNSDCPTPQVCRLERCGPECREDFDCCDDPTVPCGLVCRAEECVEASVETCNGLDDDADGVVDNGFDLATDVLNCGACGLRCDDLLAHVRSDGTTCDGGICRLAVDACADGFSNINGADADGCEYACVPTNGGIEEPDGDDNNCDGATDEGFDCTPGEEQACGAGTGICQEGVQQCAVDGTWGECADAIGPMPETCNGLDDDCNGIADDGLVLTEEVCDAEHVDENCNGQANEGCACTDGDDRPCGVDPILHGVGVCRFGAQVCVSGAWTECVGAIAPSPEFCNGLDDDCDGVIPLRERDADGDGLAACEGDCNDADPAVFTGAPERCNGTDDDCDGRVDEDFFVDEPCRGLGACAATDGGVIECAGFETARCSLDIGGSDYPVSAPVETCNRVDDDCDGTVDDVDPALLASDAENCGACGVVCAAPNSATACVAGACTVTGCVDQYALVGGSCLRCEVWPPALETCDAASTDEDCDGLRNEGCACDDGDTNPCGLALALNGVGICRVGVQSCGGGAFGACVGAIAPSPEFCNGLDDDCDGTVPSSELDADGDGVAPCAGDCNDRDASVFPGAPEPCNGLDDDCDGRVDEDYFVTVPCDGEGACGRGTYECNGPSAYRCSTNPGGFDYPDPAPSEICGNLVDDDCDGSVDEGCGVCAPAAERPCGVASSLNGIGRCRVGVQACGADRAWGACVGAIAPSPESCNGLDDDCDDAKDEDFDFSGDPANCGTCGNNCRALANVADAACIAGTCGRLTCRPGFRDVDGSVVSGCEYGCFPTNGGIEQCDGIDNDCDGAVDDDPSCGPVPPTDGLMTFRVTLPDGFPVDGTIVFCSTFATGTWMCGDFGLTVASSPPSTVTITLPSSGGNALSGRHVFNLCTSVCDDPVLGTWVVARDVDGTLSQAAIPTVTFEGAVVTTSVVRNARGTGGNWYAELAVP